MIKSILEPPDVQFCLGVRDFCARHRLSLRQFGSMVQAEGSGPLSKAATHRMFNGDCTPATVARLRPAAIAAFTRYLDVRGFAQNEIENELTSIFDPKELTNMIATRCTLSPEACRFFALKRDPFDVDHLPWGDEVFTNTDLETVAARLRDAVLYQRFVAVVGGVGTGKTLLKLRITAELEAEEGKAKLLYPEFFDMGEVTVHGIANKILVELGQKIPQNKEARVTRIREVLTQMQQEGISVAIILDEAHRLNDKVVSSLKNFWEMTNGKSSRLLGVILFGQPQLIEERLLDVKFREIRQRVQIIRMPDMGLSAIEYLGHRIQNAGGDIGRLFEMEALRRIAVNANTPLALGNLANAALMEAFEQEEAQVTVSLNFFRKLSAIGQQVVSVRRSAA